VLWAGARVTIVVGMAQGHAMAGARMKRQGRGY